ncbi:MAG TPA: hypothetical protein VK034_21760 [Enhygromyxa sp.]|nr:hypothetical protein [Enhygromyxa sp.]
MSSITVALTLASQLVAPAEAPPEHVDGGDPIEVVVETKKRPDWLFPGLDHPRVQAFFRSGSTVGGSLFDEPRELEIRPLVRAGTIKIHDALSRTERREARRFARALVDSVRPALEACYVDSLGRTPTDAARLTFRVELSRDDRGPVLVSEGVLGDVFGNACVHGVLEFAEAQAPRLQASLEIPVWFWLQTM